MQKHLLFQTEGNFSNYYLEKEETSIKHLPKTNSINIFIGTNNSGKSRFLRQLLNVLDFEFVDISSYDEYLKLVEKWKNSLSVENPVLIYNSIRQSNERWITRHKGSAYETERSLATELNNLRMSITKNNNNSILYSYFTFRPCSL